jgi:hypothetical protein
MGMINDLYDSVDRTMRIKEQQKKKDKAKEAARMKVADKKKSGSGDWF